MTMKAEIGFQSPHLASLVAAGQLSAAPTQADLDHFGVDFVIEFARARSKQVGTFLQSKLDQMNRCGAESAAVNDALTTLAKYSGGFPDGDPAALADIKGALSRSIDSLPPDSQVRKKLVAIRDDPKSALNTDLAGGTDNKVSKEEIASIQKDLENSLKETDTQSQEAQLLINNKLSEMGQIYELAAKMVQSMNDTIKGILGR